MSCHTMVHNSNSPSLGFPIQSLTVSHPFVEAPHVARWAGNVPNDRSVVQAREGKE